MIQGSRTKALPKARQMEIARELVLATIEDPSVLESAYQARRDFGPGYGYENAREWWDVQVAWHPELFTGDDAIPEPAFVKTADPLVDDLYEYVGGNEFLQSLRDQLHKGRTLSPKQREAGERVLAESQQREEADKTDPFIKALLAYVGPNTFLTSLQSQALAGKKLLSDRQREVGQVALDREQAEANKPKQAFAAVTEDGMYRNPETKEIYKVQVAVHGSGRLYAKKLVVVADAVRDADGKVLEPAVARFDFEKGAVAKLRPEWKMTLGEAKAFGALYGTCCNCGRTLTDEKSIEAGIGPVCAGKGYWA